MSHVDAAANEAKEVPLASQSAVAGKASAEAGTLARQPAPAVADLGTGEMTKAMALRVKYRLTTKRLKNWKNQVDDDAKAAKRPANTRSCGKLATLAQEV